MWDAARSGESEMSTVTWKRDSAAGSTTESGACVQTVVSWGTAAAAREAKRRRWWFSFRCRRIDMGGRRVLQCAWGLRDSGVGERARDMFFLLGFWGFYVQRV